MRSSIALAALACSAAAHAQTLEVLIVSDAPAPFVGPDIHFVDMAVDAGAVPDRMVVHGTLTGPGITPDNDEGVWMGPPGDMQELFRTGGEAPGLPGSVIEDINSYGVDWPQTWLDARFTDGSASRRVMWVGPLGELEPLVEEGAPAPGLGPDVVFDRFFARAPGKSGLAAVESFIAGPGIPANTRGIWHGMPGDLELIGVEGGQAPGMPAGVTLTDIVNMRMHGSGAPFYEVRMEGPGITGDNNNGHMMGMAGEARFVMREGDLAPGLPGRTFDLPATSAPAQIEFEGAGIIKTHYGLDTPLAPGATPTATWAGLPEAQEVVLAGGQVAPGLEPDVRIELVSNSSISEEGYVTIAARLMGPGITPENDEVIYFGTPGDLQLIARTGDAPPGLTPDFMWDSLAFADGPPGPGGVGLFNGRFAGPGVTSDDNQMLVVLDPAGEALFTFRKGTRIEVAPGDIRISTNPLRLSWADDRRLILNPSFTDGTKGWVAVEFGVCEADCDGSGALDFFDFLCFQNLFAASDPEADCDRSGELDFFDFLCFQNLFAAGCP